MQVPGLPWHFMLQDKFWLLRKMATFLRWAAWILLILFTLIIAGASFYVAVIQRSSLDVMAVLKELLWLALLFVNFLFVSETIQVILDIEENTRRTSLVMADLLSRMYPQAMVPPAGIHIPGLAAAPPVAAEAPPGGPGSNPA
jgi:hypothetical protein